jgi:hypothetical protein
MADLGPHVWRGGGEAESNGIRVLGAPIGTAEFGWRFGTDRATDTRNFCEKILRLPDTQHSWLLLYYCVVPRMNHLLRQSPPSQSVVGGAAHDEVVAAALADLLGFASAADIPAPAMNQAQMPCRKSGLGLRSSSRTATAA